MPIVPWRLCEFHRLPTKIKPEINENLRWQTQNERDWKCRLHEKASFRRFRPHGAVMRSQECQYAIRKYTARRASAGYARRYWARTTESFQHRAWYLVSQLRMQLTATY